MALNIVKRPPQNGAAVEFVEDGRGDCLTSIVLLTVCTVLGDDRTIGDKTRSDQRRSRPPSHLSLTVIAN